MKFISRLHPFFLSAIANAVLAVGIVVPASAELSPAVYKEWQDKAPEYLVIRVLSVESRQKDQRELVRFDVIAEARIEEVTRSASGLKVGDVIRIGYETRKYKQPAMAGASEIPILVKGTVGPAFLAKSKQGSTYAPAAGGRSFTVIR